MELLVIRKLKKMPYAQAHVEKFDDGSTYLWSYRTMVAEIDNEGWLKVNGLYSQTTRRHISAFLSEYAKPIDYATAKHICEQGLKINIHTGEVVEVND